ncbi:MAG: fused MFS/spermidine synthase [Elusimicrobia bacterium]|nr:fused MFS/spermidine synthase [Elusimicrobiota bacterium]
MLPSPHHAVAFLGSFLLFEAELLAAKLLLPAFGGSARVWTTCMMFFQGVLLAGYLYAHLSTTRWSGRLQARVHLIVLAAAACTLPLRVATPAIAHPVAQLLAALAWTIGAPFFALSATVPIVQAWLSRSERPERADPYALYAASNAGALAGLLAYPFVIEPLLSLGAQVQAWRCCYGLFAAAHLLCLPASGVSDAGVPLRSELEGGLPRAAGAPHGRRPGASVARASAGAESAAGWRPTPLRLLAWVALSAAPCSVMLAATQYMTMNTASVPLLWVLPLGAYLATFILAFRRGSSRPTALGCAPWLIAAGCLGGAAVGFLGPMVLEGGPCQRAKLAQYLWFALNPAGLFAIALACHRSLARSKPAAEGWASVFYLGIGLGGLLGSVLSGILVPWLGRRVGLVTFDWLVAGTLALLALIVGDWERWRLRSLSRPATAAGIAVLLWAAASTARAKRAEYTFILRNFYGTFKVSERDGLRILSHGTTIHGTQYLDPKKAAEPLSYYHQRSPIGEVFRLFGSRLKDVAVVGLGTGSLASYGRRGSAVTFYELDPDVVSIARERFSYLSLSPAKVSVVLGDARLSLEQAAGASHDIIILDAFSSDAIPTHLLTREAFELYFRRLAPGGLILCHISNKNIDFWPVLAAAAEALGVHAAIRAGIPPPRLAREYYRCRWVVLSKDPEAIRRLQRKAGWTDAAHWRAASVRLWTDGYASLLPVIAL